MNQQPRCTCGHRKEPDHAPTTNEASNIDTGCMSCECVEFIAAAPVEGQSMTEIEGEEKCGVPWEVVGDEIAHRHTCDSLIRTKHHRHVCRCGATINNPYPEPSPPQAESRAEQMAKDRDTFTEQLREALKAPNDRIWFNTGLLKVARIKADKAEQLQAQLEQRWIPVNDKLPENDDWVIAYNHGDVNPVQAYYNCVPKPLGATGEWISCAGTRLHNVTKWQPLPPAPKEQK